ncbi:hypothetical protein [Methylorubrum extorquens]
MRPDLACAIERAPLGDKIAMLRSLDARYTAARNELLSEGPVTNCGVKAALTRNTRALAKVRALASRYGVQLDRTTAEVSQNLLTEAQRNALITALSDPAACRVLAATAIRYLAGINQAEQRHV